MSGVLLLVAVPAAAGPGEADRPKAFGVTASRVAVDFVIRDKRGAFLLGLTKAEVEVYEDGVLQGIDSLELVERGLAPGEPPSVAAGRDEATPLLAIVFEGLGLESRRAVQEAVLSHLDGPAPTGPLVGMFAIDRGLVTLQAFTDDTASLRRTLGRLTGASTGFSGLREREDIRHAHAGLADGSPQTSAVPAELAGEPECRLEGEDLTRRFKVLTSRMKESFDTLERAERGGASVAALLALVEGLESRPGRKAVLLFSEGLAVPSGVEVSLRALVAAANRAGVSVYAADAAGLRARSAADETRRTIETLRTRLHLVQAAAAGARGPGAAEMGDGGLALLEQNEDALRLAPGSGLARLADQTGGFFLEATNDLGSALARIDEDLRTHYVLSYTPARTEQDGRFRSIRVKVRRPHGRLQSRQGYLAGDVPARAAGRASAAPVPVRLRALQYPADPASVVVPILVEVAAGEVAIEVVVRDGAGRAVAAASQRYPRGSSGGGAAPVLFYREARLAPGQYTVEALVHDSRGDRAGEARASLDLTPPAPGRLRASSLVLVGKAEPIAAGDETAPEALSFEGVRLHPDLPGQPASARDRPLVLFLTAWPSAERPAVDARVEVVREGRVLHSLPAGRHVAGPDGRVRIASSLPAGGLGPGEYELRLTLTDGVDAETRSESVRIAR
jgi:VWFA-related protein